MSFSICAWPWCLVYSHLPVRLYYWKFLIAPVASTRSVCCSRSCPFRCNPVLSVFELLLVLCIRCTICEIIHYQRSNLGLISVLVVFAVCCISLVSGFDLCCAVICAYSYSQVVFAASLSPLALIFAVSSKSAKERFQLCRVHTAFFLGDFQFRFGVLRLGTYTFALSRVVSALLGCWFADRGGFFYQRPLWLLLFYLKFREKDAFSMVLYACLCNL